MKELFKLTKDNPQISDEILNLYYKSVAKLINVEDKVRTYFKEKGMC